MTKFDIGDSVRLTATFTNLAGSLTNPTTVVCTIRRPDGNSSTLSNSTSSTGVYTADVTVDQSGEWNYRWSGTGALVVAEEGSFYVRERKA